MITVKKEPRRFSSQEIGKAFLTGNVLFCPLEQLIATGEAVFEFIRNSEMEVELKDAYGRWEQQFVFYKKAGDGASDVRKFYFRFFHYTSYNT